MSRELREKEGSWELVSPRAASDEGGFTGLRWQADRLLYNSVMPALAYTLDMNFRTGGSYGVNETLLSSALAALVFGILSVQPLTIVGVTGAYL